MSTAAALPKDVARERAILVLQLALTVGILALVPGNWAKLLAFLACWAATFRRLSWQELLAVLLVSLLFSAMDAMAVRQGAFRFNSPDLLGLPVWEFLMWGYYVLHSVRMLNGPPPRSSFWAGYGFAALFALPFITLADPRWLLGISALVLGLALLFFRDSGDFRYVVYMACVGAVIEYAGVWSAQWTYAANPLGGVPLWFLTLWGGVGLFTRRLVLPFLAAKLPSPL